MLLSRLQAGALVPTLQRVLLSDLVEESVVRVRRLESDGHEVRIGDVPEVDVLVDPVQIDQVLANLLENAARHAGPGATIEVVAVREGSLMRVSVDDDGVGFTPAARAALFTPFAAAPTDHSSGLGLTVCKAIVEAHGGTMSVSDSPSGGTSISFTVRCAD